MDNFYSQNGEIEWLIRNTNLPEKGIFVDVGANDGVTDSNSYWFEKHGWIGLCIDADARVGPALRKNRECCTYIIAIGEGHVSTFYHAPLTAWSGLTPPVGESQTTTVPMMRLDAAAKECFINRIDVLSVDTEGTELDVLRTIDLDAFEVKVVIVEWDSQSRPDGNHEQEIDRKSVV